MAETEATEKLEQTRTNGAPTHESVEDSTTTPESISDEDLDEKDPERLATIKSDASVAERLSPAREFLFVGVICLAQFMTQVGLGQTLSILHIIGDSFEVSNPGRLAWLIAGYSLTVGTFILVSGRLGDLFGYKLLLVIGFSWYALWSLIAGLAVYSNAVFFIFARVLSGIGPSLCLPNALAILGISYSAGSKKKNLAFALFGAVAPGGSILGAASAGLFGQLAWWPWAYWSTSIVLVCTAIISVLVIPNDPRPQREHPMTLREFAKEADVLGGVVGVVALILINFAWNQASVIGWAKAYVYVCLILGLLLLPLFFYIENRIASHPLLPYDIINAQVAFVLGCIACGWSCFGIWIYYTFQFFELLRGATPMQAAAWFSPAAITGILAAFTTAWLLGRIRPAWVMLFSMSSFAVGVILIATSPVDQIYWTQTFVHFLIITFGMDMSFPSGAIILSDAVPKKSQGIGMSLVNTTVNYSISIALGIAGTIEANVTNGDESRAGKLEGYRSAWYFGIGFAGLGMILSLLFLLKSYAKPTK